MENTKSSCKDNTRTFSKNLTTQENIRISRLKEDCKTCTKKNKQKKQTNKPEINSMIGNLQDELYELENKQAKGAKLCAHVRYQVEGKNAPKLSSKHLFHGTEAKLAPNWEQKMLYNES